MMDKLLNIIKSVKQFIFPEYTFNLKEQLLIDIITEMVKNPNTQCVMAPISGVYYMSNDQLQYWCRVWDEGITLTNHKFSFSHSSDLKFQKTIISILHDFMEQDRSKIEQTIFFNEVEMLQNVKQTIY